MFPRRSFVLGAAALATAANFARADEVSETIALWPGDPPGGPGPAGPEVVNPDGAYSNILAPRMVMRRPLQSKGAAVLILGGGGYRRIGIGRESVPTARLLTALGVTTFVLYYRLPNSGWAQAAPFQDAQRAMRLIRARAGVLGYDPGRVGIIGFSAGGHLAGMTAVQPSSALYPKIDGADALSARPDFAGLIYPVLTMIPPFITKISTKTLLGDAPTPEQRAALSVERLVTPQTPPTFLAQAVDDPIAPVDNSLLMFAALRQAAVPAAMHIFQGGRHGFNIGRPGSEASAWPGLFATWAGLA
ncbi:alpha/beta hydrolase [Beijerinckia sp. L45]|uniref:alpha/beta hydrolase n=1 Tax=Beijerinckia sp. L45 TaxID=1641855 RepID=UPI00131B61CD|nr:alpha/beta hydrolase [Beijerinckia sp. L45]